VSAINEQSNKEENPKEKNAKLKLREEMSTTADDENIEEDGAV